MREPNVINVSLTLVKSKLALSTLISAEIGAVAEIGQDYYYYIYGSDFQY